MTKVILSGCNGKMGHVLRDMIDENADFQIVAGLDPSAGDTAFPVYHSASDIQESADCLIDFSAPAALSDLLEFGIQRNIPLVLATTGYTSDQEKEILSASKIVPVFRTANLSVGINTLIELVKSAAAILGNEYDAEIVEKHHNLKKDAPSGTALMIADTINAALGGDMEYIYDRKDRYGARNANEIGILSVRGGSIVGEHEVIFAGNDEVLEIKHTAYSKKIFASGALRAAKFLTNVQGPGFYSMKDLMEG